jgi:hypothetical protein
MKHPKGHGAIMMRPKMAKVEIQTRNKGPAYQDATKTVATMFGGRAISEDKRKQNLVA